MMRRAVQLAAFCVMVAALLFAVPASGSQQRLFVRFTNSAHDTTWTRSKWGWVRQVGISWVSIKPGAHMRPFSGQESMELTEHGVLSSIASGDSDIWCCWFCDIWNNNQWEHVRFGVKLRRKLKVLFFGGFNEYWVMSDNKPIGADPDWKSMDDAETPYFFDGMHVSNYFDMQLRPRNDDDLLTIDITISDKRASSTALTLTTPLPPPPVVKPLLPQIESARANTTLGTPDNRPELNITCSPIRANGAESCVLFSNTSTPLQAQKAVLVSDTKALPGVAPSADLKAQVEGGPGSALIFREEHSGEVFWRIVLPNVDQDSYPALLFKQVSDAGGAVDQQGMRIFRNALAQGGGAPHQITVDCDEIFYPDEWGLWPPYFNIPYNDEFFTHAFAVHDGLMTMNGDVVYDAVGESLAGELAELGEAIAEFFLL